MAKGCREMKMGYHRKHNMCWLLLILIINQKTSASNSSTFSTGTISLDSTTEAATAATTTTTATTTTAATTTQPPVIGEKCADNTSCNWNNSGCHNSTCQCNNKFFQVNNITCIKVPSIQMTVLHDNETTVMLNWSLLQEEVQNLISDGTIQLWVTVQRLDEKHLKNCTIINQTLSLAICTGLSPGVRYNFSVDLNHTMGYFRVQCYMIFIQRPAQPGPINQSEKNFTAPNVSLSWNASVGLVDNYTVIVKDSNGTTVANKTSHDNQSYILITSLRHGRNYTVQLLANRLDKTSEPRNDFFSTTIMPPYSPSNVTVLETNITNSSLNLTWIKPSDFNGPDGGYIVCTLERIYPDETATNKGCIETSGERCQINSLTAGAFYNFSVYSRNSVYNSSDPAVSEEKQTREGRPGVVDDVKLVPSEDKIEVMWHRPKQPYGNIIAYKINASNMVNTSDCHMWWLITEEFNINETKRSSGCTTQNQSIKVNEKYMNVSITGLMPDSNYSIIVIAYTKVGAGIQYSNTTTTIETVPGNVTDVVGIASNATEILVSWRAPLIRTGKTYYHIKVYDSIANELNQSINVTGYEVQNLTVTGLQEYWVYHFAVSASTSKGSSSPVNSTNVTTLEASPGAAVDPTVTLYNSSNDCNATKVTLGWKEPNLEDRNGLIVQYNIVLMSGNNVTNYTRPIESPDPYSKISRTWSRTLDTKPEQQYTVQVWAITATGKEGEKGKASFKSIACTTGNMSRPVVRSEIHRLASDGNQLVFYCDFDPLSDISGLYQVTWYRDRLETGSKLMSSAYIQYNSRDKFRSLTYLSEVHITLGMTIFCSISATKLNVTAPSEPYFAGFEITSNNSLKLQYTEETLVYIRLTVPFGCRRQSEECFLGVNMFYMETGADNCLLPVAAALSKCGVRISSWRWNQSYAIRLALKDGQNLHSISRTYNIRFKTDEHFDHAFFSNYTLPRDIQVEATSDTSGLNGKECHAICDPHMLTFDGRYYENQNKGTYILYKHLKIPVQVQMRTNPCYGFQEGPPFCPCGVAIAAGRDVFVVDRCSIPIMIYMPQCDEGNLQGKIKSDGNIYQIYLPSGSWVTITSGISFNIYIYPSISDIMTTSGLCGYLDSEIQNDFMLRNGTTVPDDKFEDFNSNWLVKPEEDLFNTSNYLSLPKWPREDYFCICEEYQHGRGFQADNCSPDSRKFCPESTLNDSMAADCSRKLSTNANMTVQLDPSDFNVSESKNDTTMTNRNFTEDSANYECWSYLNSSLLFKKCSEVPDIVPESFVNTCTKDALIARTMFWAPTHLDNAQKKCIYQVTVNQPLSEQIIKKYNVTLNPDGQANNKTTNETGIYTSALLQELKDMACHMNCTNQGVCIKGQCLCCNGYGGTDCSVDMSKAPDVYGIPNRGVCDLHEMSCDHASVLGYNFADSPNLSCRLSLFQVKGNDRRSHDNSFIILKAKWISFAEISCPIVDVRSKRSVEFPDDLDTLAIGYSVAVGNNREIFGRNISLLIIDSLCVDCIKAGFDITCKLKEGFDLINRRCIKNKSAEEETESGSTVLIISTVVGSVLAVIVIGVTLHYCLIFRRKRAKYEKETRETAYAEMQEMEGQKETYSNIEEVYDEIKDLPDDYLTPQDTSPTDDESEDGEGSYEKLSDAEKNVSEGYVYLNTLTTDECESKARKQRSSTGESNMHFQ